MRGEAAMLTTDVPIGAAAGATRLIYPEDVRNAKNRIDAKVASVNANIASCTALSGDDRAAWALFYSAWRKFFCRNDSGTCTEPDVSLWGLGGQMDDTEVFEAQLYGWQEKLSATCHLSAPLTHPPTPTADQPSTLNTALVWGAVIVGGVIVLSVIDKTGLPRLFPKGR
jgi:hypothetical protein